MPSQNKNQAFNEKFNILSIFDLADRFDYKINITYICTQIKKNLFSSLAFNGLQITRYDRIKEYYKNLLQNRPGN